MIVKLGEDAHVPIPYSDRVFLGVEDSIVKDFLREEDCIVALVLGTRRAIHSFQSVLCLPKPEVNVGCLLGTMMQIYSTLRKRQGNIMHIPDLEFNEWL